MFAGHNEGCQQVLNQS